MAPSGLMKLAAAVVVIAALYLAADLLVPIVTAALLTFVLAAPVTWLERFIGRTLAPVVVLGLLFLAVMAGGWAVGRQAGQLAPELPKYRAQLVARVAELRRASSGGVVEELSKTVEAVQRDITGEPLDAAAPAAKPSGAVAERASGPSLFPWLGSLFSMAGTAAVTVTIALFMLYERRDLRNRLVVLAGRPNFALTTCVLDEAGGRVARQLLMQAAASAVYGVLLGTGLWLLDVPYPLVFGAIGAPLRFIPYVGPIVGGALPVILSIATNDGWRPVLFTAGFVLALELFTNLVVETMLYAGAAGVSQVALLVSVAFWSWLWGPMGLLLSVPLTVCVVVLGKHVKGFEFMATAMAEQQPMAPPQQVYQRLLARDVDETLALVQQHLGAHPPRSVYDTLLMPALALAASDREEGRISDAEAERLAEVVDDLTPHVAELVTEAERTAQTDVEPHAEPGAVSVPTRVPTPPHLFVYSAGQAIDRAAAGLFVAAIDDMPFRVDVRSNLLVAELASWAATHSTDAACIVDLSPGRGARARYALRRLRAGAAELPIMIGRWSREVMTGEDDAVEAFAEASHVGPTVEQSRAYLRSMLPGLTAETAPLEARAHDGRREDALAAS